MLASRAQRSPVLFKTSTRVLEKQSTAGPFCKETFANVQTRQRMGKFTASPEAKVKVWARENKQEEGTTTRSRLHLRMKKLDSARWVILVQNVRELKVSVMSKRMILRLSGSSSFCVLLSTVQECHDGFDGIARFVDESFIRYAGGEKPAGTHEKFDQSTGEVFIAVGCRDD